MTCPYTKGSSRLWLPPRRLIEEVENLLTGLVDRGQDRLLRGSSFASREAVQQLGHVEPGDAAGRWETPGLRILEVGSWFPLLVEWIRMEKVEKMGTSAASNWLKYWMVTDFQPTKKLI